MSLSNIIPSQRFELIRDAIGRVITAELANQISLGNTIDSINVFVERSTPFDSSELPAINIVCSEVQFTEELNSFNSLADCTYWIEIYTYGISNPTEDGDIKAGFSLAKIAGIIRATLMNHKNLYLDFTDKFIQTRKIRSFVRTNPKTGQEQMNILTGIVEAHYYTEETTETYTGTVEALLDTTVKLSETDKGYKFIIQNE